MPKAKPPTKPAKRVFLPTLETKVTREDFIRVDRLAQAEGRSKSEILREALLQYLERKDAPVAAAREAETVKAINAMTNRICAMLARQGAAVGTLYELTWMNLGKDKAAQTQFHEALTKAKQKMRTRLEKDEKELAEQLKEMLTK